MPMNPPRMPYLPAWDARVRWGPNEDSAYDMSTVTSMNLIDPMGCLEVLCIGFGGPF